MSWEIDRTWKVPCDCGASVFEYVHRSNDWGQFEKKLINHCPKCLLSREANQIRRVELKKTVKVLADSRYLAMWLESFVGLNRRQIWHRITGGHGYPSLGTFYEHVKLEGRDPYLIRVFHQDVAAALSLLGLEDNEVTSALDELSSLPDYDRQQNHL